MEEHYIPAHNALRKLKLAHSLLQTVYVCGATGFGKTMLVRRFLEGRSYLYFDCLETLWDKDGIPEAKKGQVTTVVIDHLEMLRDRRRQKEILAFAQRKDLWLVLIGRCPVPRWMLPLQTRGRFFLIEEGDLRLSEEEIAELTRTEGLTLTDDQIRFMAGKLEGNPFAARMALQRIKQGMSVNETLVRVVTNDFVGYMEEFLLDQWDPDLLDFLVRVSVVDGFTLGLASAITGNGQPLSMLRRAMDVGSFITEEDGVFRIRTVLRLALRNRALSDYGAGELERWTNLAGDYYARQGETVKALRLYEACGNQEGILELLARNARRDPGTGSYFELREHYFALPEGTVETSPVLMAAMSMLYSVVMNPEKSEYWYSRLRCFAEEAHGEDRREAICRLAYLDIALPHRGTANIVDIITKLPALLFNKGITLPEFSVTNNQPSLMNGGKDFCEWSRRDTFLAESIGWILERMLGKTAQGLIHAALGESAYEKGMDSLKVLTLLTSAQMESEADGKPEITFVAVGLQVRLNLLTGYDNRAWALLDCMESKLREKNACRMLPNLQALRCRIALYRGDMDWVDNWMETAPNEDLEFCTLERYRYLVKVRVYIAKGMLMEAIALIERLRYYAAASKRTYIQMETDILLAMIGYRVEEQWRQRLVDALRRMEDYHFIRIASEEGAAILPLLETVRRERLMEDLTDTPWFGQMLEEAERMAKQYPRYLNSGQVVAGDFAPAALEILRMQAEGKSIREMAEALKLTERTIKYHSSENYRKLGVRGKTEAVQKAKSLHLI